jgi:hypothetical protein
LPKLFAILEQEEIAKLSEGYTQTFLSVAQSGQMPNFVTGTFDYFFLDGPVVILFLYFFFNQNNTGTGLQSSFYIFGLKHRNGPTVIILFCNSNTGTAIQSSFYFATKTQERP